MSDRIRILIADDQNIIRWGLVSVLAGEENIEVVGEAVDGMDAVEKTRLLNPDVILMDLMMPRLDGIAAIQTIVKENPSARILVLTSHEDDQNVVAALKAGALGFLLKNFELESLLNTIQGVYHRNLSIPQNVAQKLVQNLNAPHTVPHEDLSLTEGELKVLRLLSQGLSNQEIADALSISKSTVRTHVSSLLRKLDLPSRTKAVLYAIENGLV